MTLTVFFTSPSETEHWENDSAVDHSLQPARVQLLVSIVAIAINHLLAVPARRFRELQLGVYLSQMLRAGKHSTQRHGIPAIDVTYPGVATYAARRDYEYLAS